MSNRLDLNAFTMQKYKITKPILDFKSKIKSILGVHFDAALSAKLDAAISLIVDESVVSLVDKISATAEKLIAETSDAAKNLLAVLFEHLKDLELQIEKTLQLIFQDVSNLVEKIRVEFIDPIISAVHQIERQVVLDINALIDKLFGEIDRRIDDLAAEFLKFRNDIIRKFKIPNPFDPCRKKLHLTFVHGDQLTDSDLYNLFECNQLNRLGNADITVRQIREVYANLEEQAYRFSRQYRHSTGQEIFTQRMLRYRQLSLLWKEFQDTMTPVEAYEQAIEKLQTARNEYLIRIGDVDKALEKAKEAIDTAAAAKSSASQAISQASSAQGTANQAQSTANQAQSTASQAQSTASQAQNTANSVQSSVANIVNSEAIQKFVQFVEFKTWNHDSHSYDVFVFPNIKAFDIHAGGQFYSHGNFIANRKEGEQP